MAAEFIDAPAPDEGDPIPTDQQAMSTEDLVADLTPVSTTNNENLQPVASADDDIPDKYRGKSIKEIVGMHQEAEKLIGRQGGEVGELRGIVDDYIKANLMATQAQQHAAPEPEPADFFEDPNRAVSQAIDTHPTVQRVLQEATQVKQQSNLERIQAKHPDMQQVVNSPAFVEYVKASPIRMEIFQRADRNYDYDAADELITSFKERTKAVTQATQVETEARQQQVRAASTGGGSGANTSGSKRVYRRADIRKLMKEDPDRYDQLAPEILQAYREGRVK